VGPASRADLGLNPLNPIVNVRGISDDPANAIRLLREQIRGLQEHGVAATIKHFPGDGVDYRDQHLLTSCNSLSREKWLRYHGRVFQALINSGVEVIMPGHISLPAYQSERINGFPPPATLSKELLTDLLKGRMSFRGVIVSDALTMGGFRGWYPTQLESEIQAFVAGTDVMLWPSHAYLDELERRITSGQIPVERLDDAVSRIWALKGRLGILQDDRPLFRTLTGEEAAFAGSTARNVCEQAVTLVRDRRQMLPLSPARQNKVLLVGVAPISNKGGDGGLSKLGHFRSLLEARGVFLPFLFFPLFSMWITPTTLPTRTTAGGSRSTQEYDRIIFIVIRTPHNPFGPLQLYDLEAQSAWAVNAMPKEKVIVVSLGSPYIGNEYFERVDTCINAYSNDKAMHEAVVRALLGDIPFNGISPVALDKEIFSL